jgi:hypothetical protein
MQFPKEERLLLKEETRDAGQEATPTDIYYNRLFN